MTSTIKVQNIKHTNDTAAMTVATDGKVNFPQIITNPSIPCFHVYNDSTNFTSTSLAKWGVNEAIVNNGNYFDLGNDRFVAPVAGHYYMAWSALFRNVTSGFRVWWYKNGSIYTNPSDTAASDIYVNISGQIMATMTGVFNLSASEYIEVYYQSLGAGDIYGDDNTHNGWTGHLLG